MQEGRGERRNEEGRGTEERKRRMEGGKRLIVHFLCYLYYLSSNPHYLQAQHANYIYIFSLYWNTQLISIPSFFPGKTAFLTKGKAKGERERERERDRGRKAESGVHAAGSIRVISICFHR